MRTVAVVDSFELEPYLELVRQEDEVDGGATNLRSWVVYLLKSVLLFPEMLHVCSCPVLILESQVRRCWESHIGGVTLWDSVRVGSWYFRN